MTSNEFTLWLKGYLEALETEGVESCKIERILLKMKEINNGRNQERIVYGPNVKRADQQGYVNPDTGRPVV